MKLQFGALSPSFMDQLKDYDIDKDEIKHFQKDHDCLMRLSIRNVITDSERKKAVNRLGKRISAHIR